jgi:hypothetical protein
MTGSRAAFIDLDTHVWGTVCFGDDSTAEIEGHGRVEFVYRNGEVRCFDGVYFIPKLTVNIMSVGCLNKDGYQVLICSGKLTIREPGGKLLSKVKRADNRLYLLIMKLTRPRCLVLRRRCAGAGTSVSVIPISKP